ncbi:MAG: hypothetical protein ACXQS4_01585 [Methermicoccaceae archaeon]
MGILKAKELVKFRAIVTCALIVVLVVVFITRLKTHSAQMFLIFGLITLHFLLNYRVFLREMKSLLGRR